MTTEGTDLEVFKVQQPVFDSEGNYEQIFIYNKDQSITTQQNLPKEEIERLMQGRLKIYVWGHLLPGGYLCLHDEAEEQDW